MELKTFYAQDKFGNTIPNAGVTVYLRGTETLATGLEDANGAPLPNPFFTTNAGRATFAAPDGLYDMVFNTNKDRFGRVTVQFFDLGGVLPAVQEIKVLVEEAKQSATDATTAAAAATASAQSAATDAQTASQSATAAENAATDAETAKTAAESAEAAVQALANQFGNLNWNQSATKTNTDTRTANLNLPIPVVTNPLSFDADRICNAFKALDSDSIQFLTLERYIKAGMTATQALTQAAADAKRLGWEIRASGNYNLTQNVTLEGITLRGGTFNGTGSSELIIRNCDVAFSEFTELCIRHGGGDVRFNCNKVHDCKGVTAAFLMQNGTTEGSIEMCLNEFWNTNFAILQQGTSATIHRGLIYKNYIHDANGDGIELNVVNDHYDKGIWILDNILDNINNTNSMPNWGIGIGVAGKGPYAIDMPDSQKVKNLLISGNRVTRCRQCIHVEAATGFAIVDNEVYPDAAMSPSSGMTFAGIVTYGCDNFVVHGVRGETNGANRLVYIEWGSNGATYAAPPRNYRVSDVRTTTGTVDLITANTDAIPSEVYLRDIHCKTLRWRGQPARLFMENVHGERGDIIGRYGAGEGSGAGIYNRAKACIANLNNVSFIDANGANNCAISKMAFDHLESVDCNFAVIKTPEATGVRGAVIQPAGRAYFIGASVPYGIEFNTNDVLYTDTNKLIRVTTGGALVSASEQIKAAVAGQTYIASNSLSWAATHFKTAGLRLVITGAAADGSDLTVTVTRSAYSSSGEFRCDIDPPIGKDVPAGTKIAAASVIAYTTET